MLACQTDSPSRQAGWGLLSHNLFPGYRLRRFYTPKWRCPIRFFRFLLRPCPIWPGVVVFSSRLWEFPAPIGASPPRCRQEQGRWRRNRARTAAPRRPRQSIGEGESGKLPAHVVDRKRGHVGQFPPCEMDRDGILSRSVRFRPTMISRTCDTILRSSQTVGFVAD